MLPCLTQQCAFLTSRYNPEVPFLLYFNVFEPDLHCHNTAMIAYGMFVCDTKDIAG